MRSFVSKLATVGAALALASLAAAQTTLFDTGASGLCINVSTGAQTYLGWTSGNAGAGVEQRWTPQPFTLPAGTWNITTIQAQYFLVSGSTPISIDWKIWSRNGQNIPTPADELYSGSVPFSGTASDPLPVNITLNGGDYYLTIYGMGAGAGGSGGYIGWYTNAQGPAAISFTDINGLFMWRSAQYPTPGFARYTTAAFTPDPSTDPTKFYCAEFRIIGLAAPVSYCTAGTTTSGCNANITGAGIPSATAGSGYVLTVSNVEGQQSGIVFYGVNNTGFTPSPWGLGTSFLCVKSPLERTGVQSSNGTAGACDGALSLDWNAYIASNPLAVGNPFSAGNVVYAQGWFRDPPAPKTTSMSNGLQFTVNP